MPEFIAYRAALDYLTMTTFDKTTYDALVGMVFTEDDIATAKIERIKRYRGIRSYWASGSVFAGAGVQAGCPHFIISASGGAADKVGWVLAPLALPQVKVTRVDVQVTIDLPEWYRARNFCDSLTDGEWRGVRRKPLLIENSGDDTVYVGSKKSDRFTRVYVKERDFLRYETVFRRDYAISAWERYRAVPSLSPAGILVSDIMKLPPHPTLLAFAEQLKQASSLSVQKAKPVKTVSKTFQWFLRSVIPALTRLLNDSDAGDKTAQLLIELVKESRNAKQTEIEDE